MKRSAIFLVAALAATPALAASALVATPALKPPSGGSVHCLISNASGVETIQVRWTIYDHAGTAVFGPADSTLAPHRNVQTGNAVTAQATCVARVIVGTRANLRLSLVAKDSGGNVVAAVQGY